MRKLKLEMDELAVESFPTAAGGADAPGTVEGLQFVRTQPRELCKTILTYCPCTPRAEELF